jgi:ribose transport system substrate-binding protein
MTLERARKHLRESRTKHILVGAANDPSALGALRAFKEAGRAHECVVVGQNGELEASTELRVPRTHLIGSVACFPEKHGEGVIRLARDILSKRVAPPAVFINRQPLTPETVDHLYTNDSLLGMAGTSIQAASR